MNNNIINEGESLDTDQRPRNVVWTLEGNASLRMAPSHYLPEQVVVIEELQTEAPRRDPVRDQTARRQIFLLLCLLLTSTLAYLVFSGHVRF